jgi:flavin-dependent dehydrogenase
MSWDVCVVGGGPAGSACTIRLAEMGYRVVVVDDAGPRVGESLGSSVLPFLDVLGVRDQVLASDFARARAVHLAWRTGPTERLASENAGSVCVDREQFDALLLQRAQELGASRIRPARASAPRREADSWRIPLSTGQTLSARMLVDAAGKRPVLGRDRRRVTPATVAVHAIVDAPGDEVVVEACRECWVWKAPLGDGLASAAVFFDPKSVPQASRPRLFEQRIQATPRGRLRTHAVASYLEQRPVGRDFVKIGEAAFTIDPLSSQGVQAALRSGIQGASVVNTLLAAPAHRDVAIAFHTARCRETVGQHAVAAARFYRESRYRELPFWSERGPVRVLHHTPSPARLEGDFIVPRGEGEAVPDAF